MAARGLWCSGQDSGLRVSILLHGPVLGVFCLAFVSWLLFCVFPYPFVGLWLCLFISSAVDCPHVHTLFFRRIEVRFELLSAEAGRPA
jgi:hypothetical protein